MVVAGSSSVTVASSSIAVGSSCPQVTVISTVAVEPPFSMYVKLSVGVPSLQ